MYIYILPFHDQNKHDMFSSYFTFVFVVAMLYAIETLLWAAIATTINGFISSGVRRLGI